MKLYAFSTVSDAEIRLLLTKRKFINAFKILKEVTTIQGVPKNWLITSIDYSAQDGLPRVNKDGPSHYDSNAVDVVPLTDDLHLSLPIPLNRNLLLMRIVKTVADKYDEIPVIAFEADHLHLDTLNKPGVAYFVAHRPTFDKYWSEALQRDKTNVLRSALNDRSLHYI